MPKPRPKSSDFFSPVANSWTLVAVMRLWSGKAEEWSSHIEDVRHRIFALWRCWLEDHHRKNTSRSPRSRWKRDKCHQQPKTRTYLLAKRKSRAAFQTHERLHLLVKGDGLTNDHRWHLWERTSAIAGDGGSTTRWERAAERYYFGWKAWLSMHKNTDCMPI